MSTFLKAHARINGRCIIKNEAQSCKRGGLLIKKRTALEPSRAGCAIVIKMARKVVESEGRLIILGIVPEALKAPAFQASSDALSRPIKPVDHLSPFEASD